MHIKFHQKGGFVPKSLCLCLHRDNDVPEHMKYFKEFWELITLTKIEQISD